MQQRSLFPDHFELTERAMAALRRFAPGTAKVEIERARGVDSRLVNLVPLMAAVDWFAERATAAPDTDTLARWFCIACDERARQRLSQAAHAFVEEILADAMLQRTPTTARFVDAARRVPRALLERLRGGRLAAADREGLLEDVLAANPPRADLWAHYGDLHWIDGSTDEALAAYARALLLAPEAVDTVHLAHDGLRRLFTALCAELPTTAAERWFGEAVIQGLLRVPRGSRWFTPASLIEARSRAVQPWRRFAWLLYEDAADASRAGILERREAMAQLLPEAFERYMAAIRSRDPQG